MPKFPLYHFLIQTSSLLDSGLTLVDALDALGRDAADDPARESRPGAAVDAAESIVIRALADSIRAGVSVSDSMETLPHAFPPVLVAGVRAGERTGDLARALSRYAAYVRQRDALRTALISAAIYPMLLATVGLIVLAFLMLVVVPRFSRVFADMGDRVPPVSRAIIGWGDFVGRHATLALVVPAVAIGSLLFIVISDAGRSMLLRLAWRNRWVGQRLRTIEQSRMYRTLGMLLHSGTPVVQALPLVAGVLAMLGPDLRLAAADIESGRRFSHAMAMHGLTTTVAQNLLRVGEESGNLAESLDRIAEFQEEDTAVWLGRVTGTHLGPPGRPRAAGRSPCE